MFRVEAEGELFLIVVCYSDLPITSREIDLREEAFLSLCEFFSNLCKHAADVRYRKSIRNEKLVELSRIKTYSD